VLEGINLKVAAHDAQQMDQLEAWGGAWPLLEKLNLLLSEGGASPLELRPGITEGSALMSPLVGAWISHVATQYNKELQKAWEAETWTPLRPEEAHAEVVHSLCELFMSTIEVFFGLFERISAEAGFPVALRPEWVTDLEDRVLKSFLFFYNNLLKLYTKERTWSDLLPPPAEASLDDDTDNFFAAMKRKFDSQFDNLAKLAPTKLEASTADAAAEGKRSSRRMCVQIASLLYCRRKLPELAARIESGWAAAASSRSLSCPRSSTRRKCRLC